MSPQNWTDATWMKIVSIMAAVILFFSGMFANQWITAADIQTNKEGITANTTDIRYLNENFVKFSDTQDAQTEKLSIIITDIATIKTLLRDK